jgi:tRNA 2-thiouridine synthesizing protein A
VNSELNAAVLPDRTIDVRAELCPMTFVHVRLALDRLPAGAKLVVLLRGEEARRNVPRTAIDQGHQLLSIDDLLDDTSRIVIQKKG